MILLTQMICRRSCHGRNRCILRLWMLAWVLLPSQIAYAESSRLEQWLEQGNQAYAQNRFAEAAELYERIVATGLRHPAVHFNLGNAYLKSGQLGKALVHYERAARLDPSNRAIQENLRFAEARRLDKMEDVEPSLLLRPINVLHQLLSFQTQLYVLLLLWLMAHTALALLLWRRWPRGRRFLRLAALTAGLLLLPGILSVTVKVQQLEQTEGIIIEAKADLHSGPAESNAVLVTVHEGLKVGILKQIPGWAQVVLPNGWNGWIRSAAIIVL